MTKKKEKVLYIVRLTIGLSILGVLLFKVDLGSFPGIGEINFLYIGAGLILVFLDRFCNAYRWSVLIHSQGIAVPFREILKIYFKSCYLGLILPSSVGGEFLKGYGLFQSTSDGISSFSSIIVERVFGLLALTAICGGSYFYFRPLLGGVPAVAVIGNLSMIILASIILFITLGYFFLPLIDRTFLSGKGKIVSFISKLWISFFEYRKSMGSLALALTLSFLIQFLRISLTWCAGMGLGLSIDLTYYFVFVPFITLLSLIPISLAGIGIQEGAFVYFFTLTGMDSGKTLAMALVVRILAIISVVPGGVLYFAEGFKPGAKKYKGGKEQDNVSSQGQIR